MSPAAPDPSTPPPRLRLGIAVLVALAGAVIVLPLLLFFPGGDGAPLPGPTQTPTPAVRPPQPAVPLEAGGEEHAAPTTRPAPAVQPPPSADPIIDRRTVRTGPRAPEAGPGARISEPNAAEDEWDRSPAARQRRLEQFGGTPRTEDAVEAGLGWLAAHQSADGTWDRFGFPRLCPADDRCPGIAVRRTDVSLKPGLTGLCLLAFLGAGYTDQVGPYPLVVRNAVDALLHMQMRHGGFGGEDAMAGYNDSLATLALAEYHALTGSERIRARLELAVGRLVAAQQELGGWDYYPTPATARNDTSITAWVIQALHACRAGGIDVPERTFVDAALHFVRATEDSGLVRYSDAGRGFRLDRDLRPDYRHGQGMVAAGLMAEQLLGWRFDGPMPLRQRSLMLAELPSADLFRGGDPTQLHSEYYWYYGTLAMFQRGGDDWQAWNSRLRDAVLPLQDRTVEGDVRRHTYGSWDPFGTNWGTWGRMGSRIYTTALCTLTLEVYYRHTPAYLRDDVPFGPSAWRERVQPADERERREAVAALAQLRVEVGEPVLVELLEHEHQPTVLAAARALIELDSPLGVGPIRAVIDTLPPWEQAELQRALARGNALLNRAPVRGHVRLFDPETRLATVELPWSYVGQPLRVLRDGETFATLRVIRRFTGRPVAVAQLEGDAEMLPVTGDEVGG